MYHANFWKWKISKKMFCNTMGVKETTEGKINKKQNGNEPEVELKEL